MTSYNKQAKNEFQEVGAATELRSNMLVKIIFLPSHGNPILWLVLKENLLISHSLLFI